MNLDAPVDHPYAGLFLRFAALLAEGRALPQGGLAPLAAPRPRPDAPRALILAPHPDDECIVGALPLRLQRELGFSVKVCPVTLGSRPERRAPRLAELRGACGFLGWDVVEAPSDGLAGLLRSENPRVILFPHAGDANATHRRVHGLALDALRALGADLRCAVVETEYWAALPDPNLLIESTAREAADLAAALSFHAGEVARNPYHALLPCWMADNVRRAGELVAGAGARAPRFDFATPYRLSAWNGTGLEPAPGPGRVLASGAGLAAFF